MDNLMIMLQFILLLFFNFINKYNKNYQILEIFRKAEEDKDKKKIYIK